MTLILFVVKRFYDYADQCSVSNGLRASAGFLVNMLVAEGYRARVVEAIDGNDVDRLVTVNKADTVILEALWVTPTKLQELIKLHPKVRWVVRVHSELPFLANEGIGIDWLVKYADLGAVIAFNSEQTVNDFLCLRPSVYLPNYYPLRKLRYRKDKSRTLDVGCFGAIRPLKNQLIQAFAAVRYANENSLHLRFHVNNTRPEQGGSSNLKSIVALFEATKHELVLHPWLDHEDFLDLLAEMDICLQVSFSESFNIVSADAVSVGTPLVGSSAIRWLPKFSQANVGSTDSIVQRMSHAGSEMAHMNHDALERYLDNSQGVWGQFVG